MLYTGILCHCPPLPTPTSSARSSLHSRAHAGALLQMLYQLRPEFLQLLTPRRRLICRCDCIFVSHEKAWSSAALFILSDIVRLFGRHALHSNILPLTNTQHPHQCHSPKHKTLSSSKSYPPLSTAGNVSLPFRVLLPQQLLVCKRKMSSCGQVETLKPKFLIRLDQLLVGDEAADGCHLISTPPASEHFLNVAWDRDGWPVEPFRVELGSAEATAGLKMFLEEASIQFHRRQANLKKRQAQGLLPFPQHRAPLAPIFS